MLTIILWYVILCVGLASFVRARIKETKAHKLPPALPGALPVIGHTHFLISDTKGLWQLVKKAAKICIEQGGVIYAKFGTDIYYVITDPEDAVTAANACMQKHFAFDFAKNWLGQGLITGSGETYKRHRKLLNPGSAVTVIHGFLGVFNSNSRRLVKEFSPYVDKGPFDPLVIIKDVVMEITCLTTFGSGIKDKNFLQNYMDATDGMLHITTQRFQKFYLQNDFFYKLIGFQKKEDSLISTLNKISDEIIQKKRIAMQDKNLYENPFDSVNGQEIRYKPFLDFLLELSLDGHLTDKEIRDEVDTNIVASFETISHTLANMVVLVGTDPSVQDKAYEELMDVLGTERDVEKNDLQKLVYTKSVIKETLRVMPTVAAYLRCVNQEVPLKNYTMRANTQCIFMPYGTNRNVAWGPDADDFRPGRWLEPNSPGLDGNNFIGFGIGKRSCAGMTYAMTVLTVILAHLVQNYQWQADANKMEIKMDVTLKATSGQEISIQRRKKHAN